MTPTRRRFVVVAIVGLTAVASFLVGRYWEHARKKSEYRVNDTTAYDSTLGTFHLRHVNDTFWDPGTSVVTFDEPLAGEIILYRSNRIFQESSPWVDSVQVDGNDVRWSDGQYSYSLRIERSVPTTQITMSPLTRPK